MSGLTLENKVFASFAASAAVLALNTLIKAPLTAIQRFRHGAFANKEDCPDKNNIKKTLRTDENVERVRRAHQNDTENIPAKLKNPQHKKFCSERLK